MIQQQVRALKLKAFIAQKVPYFAIMLTHILCALYTGFVCPCIVCTFIFPQECGQKGAHYTQQHMVYFPRKYIAEAHKQCLLTVADRFLTKVAGRIPASWWSCPCTFPSS